MSPSKFSGLNPLDGLHSEPAETLQCSLPSVGTVAGELSGPKERSTSSWNVYTHGSGSSTGYSGTASASLEAAKEKKKPRFTSKISVERAAE